MSIMIIVYECHVYRASTHAEISVESSADKHSYETVDKPILIMHTMTCIVPVFQ